MAAAGKLNGHAFSAVNRYGHTTCRRRFFLRQTCDTRNQNGSKELAALAWLVANPDEFSPILREAYNGMV